MSQNNRSTKNMLLLLVATISIFILLGCVGMLGIYSINSYRHSLQTANLKDMIGESSISLTYDLETGRPIVSSDSAGKQNELMSELPEQTDAFGDVQEKQVLSKYKVLVNLNCDIVGWISIEGTEIDYPVMQTLNDEEFYLHRDYYKDESKPGLPFMDDRCIIRRPSTNLIIYGHNMRNGSMFADLLKYESKSYYEKHKYIRFDTVYDEGMYEIIAVFRSRVAFEDEDTFRFYNFIEADTEEEFYEYYETIRSMSLYDIDATAISSDYLITLSTCEYSVEDGRFVVVARRISDAG